MAAAAQWLRVSLAGAAFLGFGAGAALLSWLALPVLCLATREPQLRYRRCQRVVQAAFRLFHDGMRVAGLVDFEPRAPGPSLPGRPVVLIANHPTLVDITALVSRFGPMCYLVKRPLFRNVLIGPLLRLCGQIPAGGSSLHDNLQVIDVAVARLRAGHSVMLFPEGSRSPVGGMHPFHVGAFEIARQAQVPILPVVIHAEPPGLYRGLAWYQIPRRAIRLRIEVLPQIEPDAESNRASTRVAAAQAFSAIQTCLSTASPVPPACGP